MTDRADTRARGLGPAARLVPLLGWLPRYDRAWLTGDVVAGLTVWALAVPESLAYAAIAGVPVQYGLYAMPLALVGYAVFGTCRTLFVGPSATVASISAVVVGGVATGAGGVAEVVVLSAALALLVGVLYVVLGAARMGFVARFFAKPVLDGFIIGLGLFVAIGQLPTLVGVEKPDGNTVQVAVRTLAAIGDWQLLSLVVGLASLAGLVLLGRRLPKAPGALLVAAAAIAVVGVLRLAGDLHVVGDVPTGFAFAPWSTLEWGTVWTLMPGALAVVVVGFSQSVAIAKAYGARDGYRIDANQEMIAYGVANLGAGALQGFTVTGSLSKSAAGDEAGGRSPVLLLVTAVAVVVTSAFFAGVFRNLPEATLAAIVIHAVAGMVDVRKLSRLWRAHRGEVALAVGPLLGVLLVGILPGVVIGVAASFVLLIHRLGHPHVALLGRSPGGTVFRDLARHPDVEAVPGVLVYRFEAPLVFANAEIFNDGVIGAIEAADPPPRAVVLDFSAVPDVDSTGGHAVLGLVRALQRRGITIVLARAHATVRRSLHRDGVMAALGRDHVVATVRDAVALVESPDATTVRHER